MAKATSRRRAVSASEPATRAPASGRPSSLISHKGEIDDPVARRLSEDFVEAARQAVQRAHAAGLAVPARSDGVAVEIRPDGEVVPIDDDARWSPVDWRGSKKR